MIIKEIEDYSEKIARKEAYASAVSTTLTLETALDLHDKIQIALNSPRRLYRGIKTNSQYVLVDPTNMIRKSANTANYVNEMISHWWQGFPPRHKSLICSTGEYTASGYGSGGRAAHVVLPFGNPIVGVCSTSDFWNTIVGIESIDDLNNKIESLHHTATQLAKESNITMPPLTSDYEGMLKAFHMIDMVWAEHSEKFSMESYIPDPESFFKIQGKPSTLVAALKNMLSPVGVEAMPLSNMNGVGDNNECWLSAPSLLVSDLVFTKFKKELQLRSGRG